MEVVANIAVNMFHCKLSGGFIRDWIVAEQRGDGGLGGYTGKLDQWVEDKKSHDLERFCMREGILPKDLDFELPNSDYFDALYFISRLSEVGIQASRDSNACDVNCI
jgi:hypothetical protein